MIVQIKVYPINSTDGLHRAQVVDRQPEGDYVGTGTGESLRSAIADGVDMVMMRRVHRLATLAMAKQTPGTNPVHLA